jgi:hypothetical protein
LTYFSQKREVYAFKFGIEALSAPLKNTFFFLPPLIARPFGRAPASARQKYRQALPLDSGGQTFEGRTACFNSGAPGKG